MIVSHASGLGSCRSSANDQEERAGGKKSRFIKMPALQEDGRLLSHRSPLPFLEWSGGFIGTKEGQNKGKEVSYATP